MVVTPFTPEQIELLLQTALVMKNWDAERRVEDVDIYFLDAVEWHGYRGCCMSGANQGSGVGDKRQAAKDG